MSDLSFKNNVPDPVLSGKELPTFKFELEKSTGKVMGKSFGKQATVQTTSHSGARCTGMTVALLWMTSQVTTA
jgi:hypothetical protein